MFLMQLRSLERSGLRWSLALVDEAPENPADPDTVRLLMFTWLLGGHFPKFLRHEVWLGPDLNVAVSRGETMSLRTRKVILYYLGGPDVPGDDYLFVFRPVPRAAAGALLECLVIDIPSEVEHLAENVLVDFFRDHRELGSFAPRRDRTCPLPGSEIGDGPAAQSKNRCQFRVLLTGQMTSPE